jgi:hypothetical protein
MDNFIKILEILLSWPVAFLIVSLVVIKNFGREVRVYLSNVIRIKLPGGTELERQPISSPETVPILATKPDDNKYTGVQKKIANFVNEELKRTKIQSSDLENEFNKAYIGGHIYKFLYLNEFFVDKTKAILRLLSEKQSFSREEFDEIVEPVIKSYQEEETIFNLFIKFGMVSKNNVTYSVTKQGSLFVELYCA